MSRDRPRGPQRRAAAVLADLHTRTLELMRRLGDPGLPYAEVLRQVIHPEDYAAVTTPPAKRPAGWEGQVRGRPVDQLAAPPPSR